MRVDYLGNMINLSDLLYIRVYMCDGEQVSEVFFCNGSRFKVYLDEDKLVAHEAFMSKYCDKLY